MDTNKVTWAIDKLGRPGAIQFRVRIHFADERGRSCAYEHMCGSNYMQAVMLASRKAKQLRSDLAKARGE